MSALPAERLTLLSETRSYAKPIRGGRSDHNLSDEERAAIAMAMGATNPNLASGVR